MELYKLKPGSSCLTDFICFLYYAAEVKVTVGYGYRK